MQGASRESLAVARERIDAVASGADVPRLAADLRGVAGLLVREPGLRRAFADPARPAGDRRGLLGSLVRDRISAEALAVLETAVSGRWSRPSDLLDAVELLALDAELIAAEQDRTLADVEDALFRLGRVVEGDPQLAALFSDTTTDLDRRTELVRDLLRGKATDVTMRLAEFAVAGFGGRGFDASLQRIVELAADRRDREVAYVRAAAPLTEEQEQRLATKLSGVYGRQISLKVQVDPALIGGASVRVGDDLYDGSVARRLERARAELTT